MRRWGRIGSAGRERIDLHSNRSLAQMELAKWLDRKRLCQFILESGTRTALPETGCPDRDWQVGRSQFGCLLWSDYKRKDPPQMGGFLGKQRINCVNRAITSLRARRNRSAARWRTSSGDPPPFLSDFSKSCCTFCGCDASSVSSCRNDLTTIRFSPLSIDTGSGRLLAAGAYAIGINSWPNGSYSHKQTKPARVCAATFSSSGLSSV